jgi:hypothetical protein
MKFFKVTLLIALCVLTFSCSDDDGGGTPSTQKDLYAKDVSTISGMSSSGPREANLLTNNAFTKIFGGPTGKDVDIYVKTRVKHVFNKQDLKTLRLQPEYVGDLMGWQEEDAEVPKDDSEIQTVATNDGTALWITSRVIDEKISVVAGSTVIPVDSTRVGIISLGDMYKTAIEIEDSGEKQTITFPPEFRISTVVHEARHSDCTNGFSETLAIALKNSETMDQFLQKAGVEQLECGHMHVICPANHDYAGEPACDNEIWGAYGVGAVYTLAAEKNYKEDGLEKRILEFAHMDEMSRLIKGKSTASSTFSSSSPNMNHSNE